ncbi:MAG: histidine ammonia-lyase [bacterium]|nr:histidine ammonia-lyase [bacterium]
MIKIGEPLTLAAIQAFVNSNEKLTLSDAAIVKINNSYNYLQKKIANGNSMIYGINTGFGSLCNTVIPNDQLGQLQYNLLRSHACGTGDYVPQSIVKLMLLLKAQSLSYGYSGVQLATVQRLIDFYNLDIIPVVYQQGSLGASGDLAPLAHLSLPLIGEGMVWEGDAMVPAKTILDKHQITAVTLGPKEGLALINGTQFMSAYGVHCLLSAQNIIEKSNTIASLSIDAFDARVEPFLAHTHIIRNQSGQIKTAAAIHQLLQGSEIISQTKIQVQDPYSFRCIPQVHGASLDAIGYAEQIFEREINAVTDNPNIFEAEDLIISGGNFHGQTLALSLDFAAMALAELGNISERRTFQLISGLRGLPPFLSHNPGLESGLMIAQYTAASIVSQNKQLCSPASVDSIVSSNGQEDHVSMGANGATKLYKVCENVLQVLAIEMVTAARAIQYRRPLKTSPILESFLSHYTAAVQPKDEDEILSPVLLKAKAFISI